VCYNILIKMTAKKASAPKEEEGATVEETAAAPKEKRSGKEFIKETWEKTKYNISQIPTGIEEPENKLHMTTSKLFALLGALYAIFEGRALFLRYADSSIQAWPVIFGIIGMAIGIFIFVTLNIIEFAPKIKKIFPYEWFILMIAGVLLVLFNLIAGTMIEASNANSFILALTYIKGGVLMMIGAFILLLKGSKKKLKLDNIQIISLIGIVIGVYEAIYVGLLDIGNFWAWLTAGLMVLILLLLAFSTGLIPVKLPKGLQLSWWLVLSISIAMSYLGFELSGSIINMVFLLILIAM